MDEVIDAIKEGCDVEFVGPGHAVMVTGIVKMKNGDYIFEFVHDNSKPDSGGTETSYVTYDISEQEFRGYPDFQGEKYEGPGKGAPLFIIECVQ